MEIMIKMRNIVSRNAICLPDNQEHCGEFPCTNESDTWTLDGLRNWEDKLIMTACRPALVQSLNAVAPATPSPPFAKNCTMRPCRRCRGRNIGIQPDNMLGGVLAFMHYLAPSLVDGRECCQA